MGTPRVLDGEVVKAELGLDLPEQLVGRLVKADPDELAGDLQELADLVHHDVADLAALGVDGGVDDLAHPGRSSVSRRARLRSRRRLESGIAGSRTQERGAGLHRRPAVTALLLVYR